MLNDSERATFSRIADYLIPESQGMPAFSQSGADPVCLDRVLTMRPELLESLKQALGMAASADDADTLNRENPEAIGVIGLVASSAYYLEPDVRQKLGYPGQTHRPATEDEEGDYLDLIQPVIDRGSIYRQV
jgi:hypothetical protein